MAEKRTHTEGTANATIPNLISGEFVEMGKKRVEAMIDMQKEIVDTFERMSRDWVVRAKSEADIASELATKLTAGHSIQDTATVYQEWMGRRMEMFAEDSRRLFADSQEFVKAGVRLLSNGSGGGST